MDATHTVHFLDPDVATDDQIPVVADALRSGNYVLLYEEEWNGEDGNTPDDHLKAVEYFAEEKGVVADVRASVAGFDLTTDLWWVVAVPKN